MAPDSTERFSDRVAHYTRSRPNYPPAFYAFLRDELALTADKPVADIGSGTGISARPLLERGNVVYGIEPNAAMRRAAEAALASFRNFRSVDATAEATTLPDHSVHLVLAAQAFHWFDKARAAAEFGRILRPGGRVVLVWNERRVDATPFLGDYERLLKTHGTDYERVRHENVDRAAIERFFGHAAFETRVFENEQHFDCEGLESRLLSSSYTPAAGDPRHGPMLAELRRLFDLHARDGRVTFEYETRAHVGLLASGG